MKGIPFKSNFCIQKVRLSLAVLVGVAISLFPGAMPTTSADLAKEYWLCSPGDISEKLSISFIIDLNTCQDCFVVIHDRIDFGGLDFYESKTVKPENLNGEFLWKTKKLAVQITEASAYNSKYNVSSWSTEFGYFKNQKSKALTRFATMAFPRSHNPRYITSALAIFDEDVKGEYTCTIHGDEFWSNQIKDWYEGQ